MKSLHLVWLLHYFILSRVQKMGDTMELNEKIKEKKNQAIGEYHAK